MPAAVSKRISEIAKRKQWCKDAGIEYHGDFVRSAPGTQLGNAAQPVDPAIQEQQQIIDEMKQKEADQGARIAQLESMMLQLQKETPTT